MIHRKTSIRCVLFCMLAVSAAAEDAAPPAEVPAAVGSGKRFIPLDSVRAQQPGVRVVRPIPLRFDMDALQSGALPSDVTTRRTKQQGPLVIQPPAAATSSAAAAEASNPDTVSVIRGGQAGAKADAADVFAPEGGEAKKAESTAEPVLGLYDDDEAPLLSFYDALSGRGALSSPTKTPGKQGWPLPVSVKQTFTSGFGPRRDPFTGRQQFHGGVDIAAETGTPILATAAGEVIESSTDKRYGIYVSLRHADGSVSRYGHLLGRAVRVGQQVVAGQVIGALGATGRATGPHLDYRFVVNGQTIDPMRVLTPPSTLVATR
jgi:murein DD-endopeptidase MepM/ murein hydrolase activator NlpD